MKNQTSVRRISTILLFGIGACNLDEFDDPNSDASRVSLGHPAGPDEIDSTEPETKNVAADKWKNDFNCDGFADLAIGVPRESNGMSITGAVVVVYGSELGLATVDSQDSLLVYGPGTGSDDRFGSVLAAGDFDGDGCSDLAIGAPQGVVDALPVAGHVTVLYGSFDGLTQDVETKQFWTQNDLGGMAEANDSFGASLIAGRFNGDSYDDLAIGVYGENGGVGGVHVIHGSAERLTAEGSQFFVSTDLGDPVSSSDNFGWALTAGYFDDDEFQDLAIGSPFDNGSGMVYVVYGTLAGLSPADAQNWGQSSPNIEDNSEPNDRFGSSLSAGDFNADGIDDLAIGVVGESIGADSNTGAVNTIYGSLAGLTATGDQFWHQDSFGILDQNEDEDSFASSLVAGDFDADGHDDLAIGVVSEDVPPFQDAGAVSVLYGSDTGLSVTDQFWHQNSVGIDDACELGDNFGSALAMGDFNGDDAADLAIGVQSEDVGAVSNAGAVSIIYGDIIDGLVSIDQFLVENVPGEAPEPGDVFGAGLSR